MKEEQGKGRVRGGEGWGLYLVYSQLDRVLPTFRRACIQYIISMVDKILHSGYKANHML